MNNQQPNEQLELQPEHIQPGIGIEALEAMDRQEAEELAQLNAAANDAQCSGGESAKLEDQVTPEEVKRKLRPKIYVASLSDYNSGTLHGQWIDADQEPDDIGSAVQEMLAASQEPHAEEWAIHDFEDFGSIFLGEWESFANISRLGKALAQHGRPFAYWANYVGHGQGEELDRFEASYMGVWGSLQDFLIDATEDYGLGRTLDEHVPSGLRPYVRFDYELLAHDMAGDLHVARDEEGLHVFRVE
jgi:antirestriction protein